MPSAIGEHARVTSAERALETLEGPWRAQERDWSGDPSATWVWLETGLRQVDRAQPLLVLGTAERPVACLHLQASLAFPLTRVLDRFAWAPGVTEPEIEAALAAARAVARIYLPYVPFERLPPRLVAGSTRPAGECPQIAASTWSAHKERLSSRYRKALRRADRAVAESGLGFKAVELAPGETAARLAELVQVERDGHRLRGRLLSGKRARFIARVIEGLDAGGRVRTHVIEGGRGVCAYLIGFATPRRYLLYSTSFDARYEHLSLGTLVLRDALKGALDRGEAVDMGNGRTPHKLHWSTGVLPLANFLLLPRADNRLAAGS